MGAEQSTGDSERSLGNAARRAKSGRRSGRAGECAKRREIKLRLPQDTARLRTYGHGSRRDHRVFCGIPETRKCCALSHSRSTASAEEIATLVNKESRRRLFLKYLWRVSDNCLSFVHQSPLLLSEK